MINTLLLNLILKLDISEVGVVAPTYGYLSVFSSSSVLSLSFITTVPTSTLYAP